MKKPGLLLVLSTGMLVLCLGTSRAQSTAQAQATWTDPATGLVWPLNDNGDVIDWSQAESYCQKSRLGGYLGWRLPTVSELAAIYDPTKTVGEDAHIKGAILLTDDIVWSSEAAGAPGDVWVFNFYNGHRFTTHASNNGARALCVLGNDRQ